MAIVTNKSIFYHIPKTGGTWVTHVFGHSKKGGDGSKYKRPGAYYGFEVDDLTYWKRFIPHMLNLRRAHETPWSVPAKEKRGLFSFAFVRKPLPWLKSFWIDRWHASRNNQNLGYFLHDLAYDDDFEVFVRNALKMFPEGLVTTIFKCYLGRNGKGLDFVGKQETLRDDLVKALTLAGESFDESVIRKKDKINTSALKKGFSGSPDIGSGLEKKLNKREKWVLNTFYK